MKMIVIIKNNHQEMIENILNMTEQILKINDFQNYLLSDYFDLEKLHHQQFNLIPHPFELNSLIDEIIYVQKINGDKKGIEIIQTEMNYVDKED